MSDTANFPMDELKAKIEEVLKLLQQSEAQLKALAGVADGTEELEEEERNRINIWANNCLDQIDTCHFRFEALSELSPDPFATSELNYARMILKRHMTVCTHIHRITQTPEEKALAEMQLHMMIASAENNNQP